MAGHRYGKRHRGVSWSERQIMHHGAAALRYAKEKTLATQADIASWCRPRRSVRLVAKWLKGESLITFAVLGSGRLRPHILHYLDVCDQRVRKTLPRVARKRNGGR
jgi:hypothetical protein